VNLAALPGSPLWAAAQCFAQANAGQDERLRDQVAAWVDPARARVLELFAGVGNLTRGLAREGATVVAVERAGRACDLLRRNLAIAAASVDVREGDALQVVEQLVDERARFDVVVLDPPREGCAAVIRALLPLQPARVIYVSCDPMTLARDLRLLASAGYVYRSARGLDMMPQTYHVEAVVLMERDSTSSDRGDGHDRA